jgi:hypothetical protein
MPIRLDDSHTPAPQLQNRSQKILTGRFAIRRPMPIWIPSRWRMDRP